MRRMIRFSSQEVLGVCQRFVYPPCNKHAGSIRLTDSLTADLGYGGEAARLLALKTNQTFQMAVPVGFTSIDVSLCHTVEQHVLAICEKLARAGRLIH
jgi:hypothetical protein